MKALLSNFQNDCFEYIQGFKKNIMNNPVVGSIGSWCEHRVQTANTQTYVVYITFYFALYIILSIFHLSFTVIMYIFDLCVQLL